MKTVLSIVTAFLITLSIVSCNRTESSTILIPTNVKGRVNIIFNQSMGSPPKYENGRRLYEIPSSGILLTQFESESGNIDHEHFYIDSDGKRSKLKNISPHEEENTKDFGVLRSGTSGVYGNSKASNALVYQEFYLSSSKNLKNYLAREYDEAYIKRVHEIAGSNE